MVAVTIGGKAFRQIETGRSAGDQIKQRRGNDRADQLRDHVLNDVTRREAATGHQADGNRRIEMAPRYVPDGVGHGHDGKTEGQCNAKESNANVGESRSNDGTAASSKRQPERSDRFSDIRLCVHFPVPRLVQYGGCRPRVVNSAPPQ